MNNMKTFAFFLIALIGISLHALGQDARRYEQNQRSKDIRPVDRIKTALAEAKIDPAQYEFSGQVTATVYLNGRNYESSDYCLYSLIGNQVRGISRGMWFEPTKKWVHNHLTYSNVNEGDTIRFRLYDADSDTWYDFEEYVIFESDMIKASAIEPFRLEQSKALSPSSFLLSPSLEVWPNPFSERTTIDYTLPSDQPVIIQVIDHAGKLVQEINLGKQPMGRHQYEWNVNMLQQGAYYLYLKDTKANRIQVIIAR